MNDLLIVSGSPRKKNCMSIAMKMQLKAEKGGFRTTLIDLSETPTKPCINCGNCREHHKCTDKAVNDMNAKLADARGILIVTPVYFGGVSAQLKALIDRTLPLRQAGLLLKDKLGAAIAVGSSRNGGQELALHSVHSWMLIHGMLVIGDDSHFGGTLTVPIEEDEYGLATLHATLNKMLRLLNRQ